MPGINNGSLRKKSSIEAKIATLNDEMWRSAENGNLTQYFFRHSNFDNSQLSWYRSQKRTNGTYKLVTIFEVMDWSKDSTIDQALLIVAFFELDVTKQKIGDKDLHQHLYKRLYAQLSKHSNVFGNLDKFFQLAPHLSTYDAYIYEVFEDVMKAIKTSNLTTLKKLTSENKFDSKLISNSNIIILFFSINWNNQNSVEIAKNLLLLYPDTSKSPSKSKNLIEYIIEKTQSYIYTSLNNSDNNALANFNQFKAAYMIWDRNVNQICEELGEKLVSALQNLNANLAIPQNKSRDILDGIWQVLLKYDIVTSYIHNQELGDKAALFFLNLSKGLLNEFVFTRDNNNNIIVTKSHIVGHVVQKICDRLLLTQDKNIVAPPPPPKIATALEMAKTAIITSELTTLKKTISKHKFDKDLNNNIDQLLLDIDWNNKDSVEIAKNLLLLYPDPSKSSSIGRNLIEFIEYGVVNSAGFGNEASANFNQFKAAYMSWERNVNQICEKLGANLIHTAKTSNLRMAQLDIPYGQSQTILDGIWQVLLKYDTVTSYINDYFTQPFHSREASKFFSSLYSRLLETDVFRIENNNCITVTKQDDVGDIVKNICDELLSQNKGMQGYSL